MIMLLYMFIWREIYIEYIYLNAAFVFYYILFCRIINAESIK